MNRRLQVCLVLGLVLAGGIGMGHGASGAPAPGPTPSYLRTLNALAAPSAGADPVAVRKLVDAAFATVDLPDSLPIQSVAADLKGRLVRSELQFRAGKSQGIPELNVVLVVNGLAAKLGAPEYAKSSRYEVRKLRSGLLSLYPNLIRRAPAGRALGVPGGGLQPEMSPVEAFVVLSSLLQQKRFHPDWQVTQAERLASWSHKPSAPDTTSSVVVNPRAAELERKLAKSLGKMAPSQIVQLSHNALTLLGVGR